MAVGILYPFGVILKNTWILVKMQTPLMFLSMNIYAPISLCDNNRGLRFSVCIASVVHTFILAFPSHLTKSSDGRQCGNEIAQQVTQLGRMRCIKHIIVHLIQRTLYGHASSTVRLMPIFVLLCGRAMHAPTGDQ